MNRALTLLGALPLIWGCAGPKYMPASSPSRAAEFTSPRSEFKVGVARADITPPPGVATFGHGPDALATNGVWTRLYCRVFWVESDRVPLALIPCDLSAISMLLQRRVAEEAHLSPARIMLTATHTHAGPAHYFDGAAYSGLGSTEVPGFDPEMVTWLAKRIATAITKAAANSKPAELRWAHAEATQLTRNRDVNAFLRNTVPPEHPPCTGDIPLERCAIDPQMDVLEFRESTNRCPIGWLGFFAMHPTVLPASSRLLGADIFGVASRKLEASLRQQRQSLAPTQCEIDDPLAGIVNTNEADMSPRWTSGSIEEAKLIGRQLATAFLDADRAAEKQSTPFDPKPSLAARYVEYPMQDNAYAGAAEKTCPRAALGVLSSAGASDHRTFLFNILGDQQPDPKHRDACHEFKALFPGPIKKLSGGPKAFTSTVSSSVVRIGDTAIGFVPAELTIAAGAQVKRALKEQLPGTHAIVGGLTNGYIQYVATEEEYQRQGYEGASTLFGPHSAALLSAVAGDLARNLSSPEGPLPGAADVATAAPYYLGPERARLPIGYDETPLSELQDRGARGLCSLTTPGLESVCFDFRDGAPGVAHSTYPRWIAVVDEQGRALLDDRGTAFRTVVHERAGDSWRWTTLVTPSREERAAIGTHRVRVVAGIDGQSPIYSAPFELVGLAQLPRCTPNEQVSCGL